jgi:hypothetical protein
MNRPLPETRIGERGNMLFIILIAVALLGLLTAAVQYSGGSQNSNIDGETMMIKAGEIQRDASELERAVMFIRENGISENDLRFASPGMPADYGTQDATPDNNKNQVFHARGGAAKYRGPPDEILATSGMTWEFFGGTALPQVGSDKADLVAVIPDVTKQFCDKINQLNGLTGQPADDGTSATTCIDPGASGRFGSGTSPTFVTFDSSPNTMDEASFSKKPVLQACVQCASDDKYYFYHVLIAR